MAPSGPMRTNAFYGAAHYGKSLFWYTTELIFAFYLAEIYGLEPQTVGALLFAFLLWDAVTDPIIGLAIVRRRISTRGLVRLQAVGAILTAGAFLLLFHKPQIDADGLVLYALIVGVAFRTTYTLYDVPQNTLMSRLSLSDRQRLTLSTLRSGFSGAAKLTVSLAAAQILTDESVPARAAGFSLLALVFAVIAIASALALTRIAPAPDITGEENAEPVRAGAVLRATLLSPPLAGLFVAIALLSVGWPLFTKLIPFFAEYVRGAADKTGLYGSVLALSAMASLPVWLGVGHRVPRDVLIGLALIGLGGSCMLFGVVRDQSEAAIVLALALMAASHAALGLALWARLADRLSEAKLVPANDVLAFGVFTFSSKVALSLGGLLLGFILAAVDYERGRPFSAQQSAALTWTMALAPFLAGACAIALERLIRAIATQAR